MELIFQKKLTKTDVGKKMSMKTNSLRHFPAFEHRKHILSFKVEDEETKEWDFRLMIRKQGYKKPILSVGWLHFVETKKLQIGDHVQFLKEKDSSASGGVKYKIKLVKQVKLFGAVIGSICT